MEVYGVFWERQLSREEEQVLLPLLPPHRRQRTEQIRRRPVGRRA